MAARILWLAGLVLLGQRLSTLFVQAYLWDQGGNLTSLTRFNLALYVGGGLAFIALGRLVKSGGAIAAYRLGLALQSAFFILVLFLGRRSAEWLEPLGLLSGLGVGAFWAGQNLLNQQATTPETRRRFWGYIGVLFAGSSLAGPVAGGWLIARLGEAPGYRLVFALAALSFVAAAALSAGVRSGGSSESYRLKAGVYGGDSARDDQNWRRVLYAHVVGGFRDGVLAFLPAVLVYAVTGDAETMGNFAAITSAVGLTANWATGRWLRGRHRFVAMAAGGLMQALGALVLLAHMSYGALLAYTLVVAVFGPLQGVPWLELTFNAIGAGRRDRQVERIVVREIALVVGRVLGMLMLLITARLVGEARTATIALGLVALAAIPPAWLLRPLTIPPEPVKSQSGKLLS